MKSPAHIRNSWHLIACTAVLLGCVAGGCGSSGEAASESTGGSIPKALYIDRADRICEDNYTKRGKLLVSIKKELAQDKKSTPTQSDVEEAIVKRLLPLFREESEEVKELPSPDEGAEEAQKVFEAFDESIDGAEANLSKVVERGATAEFGQSEKLAEEFGFEWCGRS